MMSLFNCIFNSCHFQKNQRIFRKWYWLFVIFILVNSADALQIAKTYQADDIKDITEYWISEKLDGVRGYWDGEHLYTKNGNQLNPPNWFTENLGQHALDGELWVGRQLFSEAASIVLKQQAQDQQWRKVNYMIFDMPDIKGDFDHRLAFMRTYIKQLDIDWVKMIPQEKVANLQLLEDELEAIAAIQGEGLMLHYGKAKYENRVVDHLLKLKLYDEAVAEIVGYVPGKGKYQNMLGALRLRYKGKLIKVGSGLTDAQRRNPPAIGTKVSFRFNGYTRHGLPRFPRIIRLLPDWVD